MIVFKRILGFLTSIILATLLVMVYYFPAKIYIFMFLSLFFCVFYFIIIKNRFISYLTLGKYFSIVLFFLVCFWSFFIVIDIFILKYILIFFFLVYSIVILDSVFRKIYLNKDISHPLLIYIDLVCFWLITYFLLYLIIIFRVNLWWTGLGLLIAIISSVTIRFYWYQINLKKNLFYLLGLIVVLGGIFVFTSLLAFNLYALTFIMWLWYYILMDFSVDKINEEFIGSKKRKLILLIILLFIFHLISVR